MWIKDSNRARPTVKVHVIDLRTVKKQGGVIRHEPLTASVFVNRKWDMLFVEVNVVFAPPSSSRLVPS